MKEDKLKVDSPRLGGQEEADIKVHRGGAEA